MAGLLTRLPSWLADERGVSLVTALVITLAVFALGGVWTGLATPQVGQSAREALREQARNTAEAGINEAMSGLSADAGYPGSALTTLAGTGEYEVTVTPLSSDPNDNRRYILSTGYAPSKAAPRRLARRLEQQVDLIPTSGFRYALLTAPGGIGGANRMTVNGDVYSDGDLTLANNAAISGNVTSLGSVTTSNNSTIGGDIRAAGDVTVNNASTTVLGNVYSGGNVLLTGRVRGNVQAAGTITGGTVDGSRAQFSPPRPPQPQTLPAFTWNPANYPSSHEWSSPGAFQNHWSANKEAFGGHHRILCPAPCTGSINLDARWTMTGDVTIASDAPVTLSREVANGTAGALTLTVASFSSASPAILMSNNISLPDSIRIALFAPNGTVRFSNLKNFSGAVYASSMVLDQQFTLTFVPVTVPGFSWNLASSTQFIIQARTFREVPAT
jgi:cytoskeletal protein CcmA (bactofilin family)